MRLRPVLARAATFCSSRETDTDGAALRSRHAHADGSGVPRGRIRRPVLGVGKRHLGLHLRRLRDARSKPRLARSQRQTDRMRLVRRRSTETSGCRRTRRASSSRDRTRRTQISGCWIWLVACRSRITFDTSTDNLPIWSHDGRRILWPSRRSGTFDLYIKPATGAGQDERLIAMGTATGWPTDWSRDGRFVAVSEARGEDRARPVDRAPGH